MKETEKRYILLSKICDSDLEISESYKKHIARRLSYRLTSSEIISFSSLILKNISDQSEIEKVITKYESVLNCLLSFQNKYIKYHR